MNRSKYLNFTLAYTFTPIYININNIIAVEPHNVHTNSMSIIRCIGESFTVIDRVQTILDMIELAESKFEQDTRPKRRK